MKKNRENGAIVVDATISLTAFIFTIFTILSVVNICYIQSKIGIALDSATKELAQYSYLYYKIGVDKLEAQLNEGTAEVRDVSKDTVDGIVNIMDSFSEASNSASTGNFDGMMNAINNGIDNADSLYRTYADSIADNPKELIIGLGKMAGNDLKERAKNCLLAKCIGKGLMKKNLKAFKDDDPDAFLKRYHVVDGMDGLDFKYSSLMAYGESNKIQLVCTYKVRVIKLLNIDFEFQFRQIAKTNAWGNGVSLIKPDLTTPKKINIWDTPSPTTRGKLFVIEEKNNYKYTDTGHGFDAYVNDGGKNEFITIISKDTNLPSNNTSNKLKNQFRAAYNDMYNKVSRLGNTITVKNQSDEDVTFDSNPNTRTYVIRVVVPDNADMNMVKKAKNDFEREVSNARVEIVTGYGSPTPNNNNE